MQHVAGLGIKYNTIGTGLYLSRGKDFGRQKEKSDLEEPTLILIFGWMGAQLPHLQKYTTIYEDLYPEATKVVVRSESAFFFRRSSTNEANLQPVKAVLEAEGCLNHSEIGPNPRVLVHSFSNGGAAQLVTLGRILASSYPLKPLTSAIVFDSAPGRRKGSFCRGVNAFTAHMRNPILKALAKVSFAVFFVFMAAVTTLTRRRHRIDALNDGLESPHILPWMNKDTPRLFIYSKEDAMIDSEHVEQHAEDLKDRGFVVRTERFSGTGHVNHARTDPPRYWGAIGSLWTEARKRFSSSNP